MSPRLHTRAARLAPAVAALALLASGVPAAALDAAGPGHGAQAPFGHPTGAASAAGTSTPAPPVAPDVQAVAARAAGALAGSMVAPPPRSARPVAAAPTTVTGIVSPCPVKHPYPTGAAPRVVVARLAADNGITLTGSAWTDPRNANLVRLVWETLDAISCTDYLAVVKKTNPHFTLNAAPIRSWAWGNWGITRPGAVTLDFAKWQTAWKAGDRGRLVRILVHEIGHAWSRTPQAQPTYAAFAHQYAKQGNFGPYAHNVNENFSEVIGYYVARCAVGNPYASKKFAASYALVKAQVFHGREFGPAVGTRVACTG